MSSSEPTAATVAPAPTSGPAQTAVRYLGVPTVARLAMFARDPGPAVLLTTEARLELYSDTHVFGALRSVNPSLADWHDKRDKVVVSLDHALRAFPRTPELYALELAKGRDYKRYDLLERLVQYGFERDEAPGFVVRGDTVTVYLTEEAAGPDGPTDEVADGEGTVRLAFFGDELAAVSVNGAAADSSLLAPRRLENLESEAWTARLLEKQPGTL